MSTSESDKHYTVIVGAGITGLTTAHNLAKKGEKCLLIEKEKTVGGLCRTYVLDDIVFDLGPHLLFYNPDFEAEQFLLDLLKDEETIQKRFRFAIYRNGRHWKYPLTPIDLLFYPWKYKKQLIQNLLGKKEKKKDEKPSVGGDIIAKGGPLYYEEVLAPMLLHKTLLSGDKIHRDWVARVDRDIKNEKEPFKEVSHAGFLQKVMKTFYQTYYYPKKGFARFPEILWERFSEAGGETVLDCGPITFAKKEKTITGVTVKGKTYPVKEVIWTASVNELNEVLEADLPKIKYVKTSIAFLTYNQDHPVDRPFAYIYYPREGSIFNRGYYPSSIYGKDYTPGKEGLCLELNHEDELDALSDEEVLARCVEEVETLGLFKKDQLREQKLVRLGECMPVYDLDYENHMKETYKEVHAYSNLHSIGRLGGYFFCMTPPATSQGLKMARHLLQEEDGNESS